STFFCLRIDARLFFALGFCLAPSSSSSSSDCSSSSLSSSSSSSSDPDVEAPVSLLQPLSSFDVSFSNSPSSLATSPSCSLALPLALLPPEGCRMRSLAAMVAAILPLLRPLALFSSS
ncbi:hypothetical protein Vafri_8309, partial [Volvox africanus]